MHQGYGVAAERLEGMEIWAWALLAFAALIAGFGKTALPGSSTIAVVILASVLPARTSTAAMLLLFIVGDVFALIVYRRHADWRTLLRQGGGGAVNYQLYTDSARSIPWGDGTAGTSMVTGTGSGNAQTINVYGQVPAQATPAPGSYSDTITATIVF